MSRARPSSSRSDARKGWAGGGAALAARAVSSTLPRLPRRPGSKYQAGAFDAALGLLATAQAGPLDELQLAQVDLLHGQIAFALSRGSDAPPLLLKAAKRFEPLDGTLAGETYLEALTAVRA